MKTEAAQCHDSCEASPACTDAGGGALCPGTKLSALVGNQGCSLRWEDVATTTDTGSPLYPWLGQGVTIGHLCPKACGSCDANASSVGEPPRYPWHLGCILLKMPSILVADRPDQRLHFVRRALQHRRWHALRHLQPDPALHHGPLPGARHGRGADRNPHDDFSWIWAQMIIS